MVYCATGWSASFRSLQPSAQVHRVLELRLFIALIANGALLSNIQYDHHFGHPVRDQLVDVEVEDPRDMWSDAGDMLVLVLFL